MTQQSSTPVMIPATPGMTSSLLSLREAIQHHLFGVTSIETMSPSAQLTCWIALMRSCATSVLCASEPLAAGIMSQELAVQGKKHQPDSAFAVLKQFQDIPALASVLIQRTVPAAL